MNKGIRLHWLCEGSSAVCPLHMPWMLNAGSSAAEDCPPHWWQDPYKPLDEPWRTIEAWWVPTIEFGTVGWKGQI